jgi:O-methyltransferase involved in polyketide biosynthesis
MDLRPELRWVEVDLPEVVEYKESVIGGEKPACSLERVRLDLADRSARCDLFDRLGHESKRALIITEGLLTYLAPDEVGALAEDLARPISFQSWVLELSSPGLLELIQKQFGPELSRSGMAFQFGPAEGPAFFGRHGWKPVEVRSMLKTARRLKQLSPWMWVLSLFPEPVGAQGSRPWSGVVLLSKA